MSTDETLEVTDHNLLFVESVTEISNLLLSGKLLVNKYAHSVASTYVPRESTQEGENLELEYYDRVTQLIRKVVLEALVQHGPGDGVIENVTLPELSPLVTDQQ